MLNHRIKIDFQKLYYYCCLGLFAALPVSIQLFGAITVLSLVIWLVEGNYRKKLEILSSKNVLLLILLLFAVEALTLFYSQDLSEGYNQIEKRFVPAILVITLGSSLALNIAQQKNLFASFSTIIILLSLVCYLNAVITTGEFYPNYDPDKFYYSYNFSRATYTKVINSIHPGYFSMFILLAISFFFQEIVAQQRNFLRRILYILAVAFLILNLIFLSSKIHIALLFAITFYFLYKGVFQSSSTDKRMMTSIGGCIAVAILAYAILQDGQMQYRLNHEITYSFVEKYQQWKAAAHLWLQNPLLGVGIGDRQLALNAVYSQFGFTESIGNNPHNQYLEYLTATGLVGFSIFAVLTIKMFRLSIGVPGSVFLLFNIIWACSSLTESIFVRFWGLCFFVLFAIIFTKDHER